MSNDANKPVVVELGIEFVVELLLFLYPYGADQMGLPHNFWLGLGCWIGGTIIAIRMFWIFPLWAKRISPLAKSIIAVLCVAGFIWLFYRPVMEAHAKWKMERQQTAATVSPASTVQGAPAQGMQNVNSTPPANTPKKTAKVSKPIKKPTQQAALRDPVSTPAQPKAALRCDKCNDNQLVENKIESAEFTNSDRNTFTKNTFGPEASTNSIVKNAGKITGRLDISGSDVTVPPPAAGRFLTTYLEAKRRTLKSTILTYWLHRPTLSRRPPLLAF